jgi:hypothetical protein
MRKRTILIMLIISLVILSGCEIKNFRENYALYKNQEENERVIAELEKDMERSNNEVKIVFDACEKNKNSAEEIEAEIIEYINNNQVHGYDINNSSINDEAFLEYNLIVLKTHLMSYVEDHINDALPEVTVSDRQQAMKKFKDELTEKAEIMYFHDFDNSRLEQVIFYELDNGLINMFSMLWEHEHLTDTDFMAVQEFGL